MEKYRTCFEESNLLISHNSKKQKLNAKKVNNIKIASNTSIIYSIYLFYTALA